jgi:hypothetical protein
MPPLTGMSNASYITSCLSMNLRRGQSPGAAGAAFLPSAPPLATLHMGGACPPACRPLSPASSAAALCCLAVSLHEGGAAAAYRGLWPACLILSLPASKGVSGGLEVAWAGLGPPPSLRPSKHSNLFPSASFAPGPGPMNSRESEAPSQKEGWTCYIRKRNLFHETPERQQYDMQFTTNHILNRLTQRVQARSIPVSRCVCPFLIRWHKGMESMHPVH